MNRRLHRSRPQFPRERADFLGGLASLGQGRQESGLAVRRQIWIGQLLDGGGDVPVAQGHRRKELFGQLFKH